MRSLGRRRAMDRKRRWHSLRAAGGTLLLAIAGSTVASTGAVGRDEYANVHTIGIISDLGDDVPVLKVYDRVPLFELFGGSTPPNSTEILHSGWRIDEFVASEIASALAGHFTTKSVAAVLGSFPESPSYEPPPDAFGRQILALPADAVDAYVVVHRTELYVDAGPSGFDEKGLEVANFSGAFGGGAGILANFQIGVFDARTGYRIDYATARLMKICKSGLLADNIAQLSPLQKDAIRSELLTMIHKELPSLLRSAGLISRDASEELETRPLPPGAISAGSAASAESFCS
jgi:hypothetical protein